MFMSSVWMCHVAAFCIFRCKAMWSTAHRYYSTGAGHSVPLKQFTHPLALKNLWERDIYTKHIYAALMLYAERGGIKIWIVNFSIICLSTGCTVVLEDYCYCDELLQWNLSSCIEIPPEYAVYTQKVHTWLVLYEKRCDPKTSLL